MIWFDLLSSISYFSFLLRILDLCFICSSLFIKRNDKGQSFAQTIESCHRGCHKSEKCQSMTVGTLSMIDTLVRINSRLIDSCQNHVDTNQVRFKQIPKLFKIKKKIDTLTSVHFIIYHGI